MKWKDCMIRSASNFKLSRISTQSDSKQSSKKKSRKLLKKDISKIARLQNRLFAEDRQSLLIILQGMDSGGKDGTICNIMSGVNTHRVAVVSFKYPSTQGLWISQKKSWKKKSMI